MLSSTKSRPEDRAAESLQTAILRIQASTISIVGNCSQAGSPPPEWTLLEPLPAGSAACAVQVEDSFIELPIGHPQLWLNRLHVIAAQGRTNVNTTPANTDSNETSSLVVHNDGDLWITNTVFQGAGDNTRAIDLVATGRSPSLYCNKVTFVGFRGVDSPTLRLQNGTCATVEHSTFRNLTLLADGGTAAAAAGSAVTALTGCGLLLLDVSLEDNVVDGAPAGARAIGLWDGGRVFATPETPMWQLPQGPAAASEAVANVSEFPVRFLDAGGGFRGLEAEQELLVAEWYLLASRPHQPAHGGAVEGAEDADGVGVTVSQVQIGQGGELANEDADPSRRSGVDAGLVAGCAAAVAVVVGLCATLGIVAVLRSQGKKLGLSEQHSETAEFEPNPGDLHEATADYVWDSSDSGDSEYASETRN